MSEITTTKIDVEKIKGIFDEIHEYLLDNRYDEEDVMTRVRVTDAILSLTQEVIEIMYRTNFNYLDGANKQEVIEIVTAYKQAQDSLYEIQKMTDIIIWTVRAFFGECPTILMM